MSEQKCRVCGCTQDDCRGCVERTGKACHWVEPDLCSACTGEVMIYAERTRQVAVEGWTSRHDDTHVKCELRKAAECYARPPALRSYRRLVLRNNIGAREIVRVPWGWPWDGNWWKPSGDRVRELVKAGALFMAEAERQKRAGHKSTAVRMLGKALACARKIDRLQRPKRRQW